MNGEPSGSVPAVDARWVGTPVQRLEDPRFLTGDGRFVDDLEPPGTLHVAFVRSQHAAATLASVEVGEAAGVAGVKAVLTHRDFEAAGGLRPVLDRPEFVPTTMPLLAADVVRYVGEPIAVVVAESRYAAEDGAEAVMVEYQPVVASGSIESSLAEGAESIHAEAPGNVLLDVLMVDDPDLEEAFASAAEVIETMFRSGRVTAVPIETRAALGLWDRRSGRLILHVSHQIPSLVRTAIADVLGLSESQIQVITEDVGGGFGQKCVVGREEVLVAALTMSMQQPVKWVEDRLENLAASFHGHEQRYSVRVAFDTDGILSALDADIVCDVGAYSCYPFTCGVEPLMAATEMPGPYRLRHYRARTRGVATNKAPMAPYRGVSRPQITFVLERLMDIAARRMEIDPVEIRRRNLISDEEFPYVTVTNLTYDSGSYLRSLELCAELLAHESWPARQEAARREGRLLGIGFSCFCERTGYGTAAFASRKMAITPGYERATITMDPSGGVTVATGTLSHGQGHRTTYAQIVADELGLLPQDVRVVQGDTDRVPYGWGTFASRSLVIGGGAVKKAAEALADHVRRIGAHLMETDPQDVGLLDGKVVVRGSERHVQITDVARTAYHAAHRLPEGQAPGLEATASYDPEGTFSNATHGVVVEVDPQTGEVHLERYVVVEDCGVIINPMIVEGQVHGGVAQGIAAALYERLVYDREGQLLTGTLGDYLIPTASEVPRIEVSHLVTPAPSSPTGAKGMGEGGTIGAPAAVANAVSDALAHLGVEVQEIPITPEYVLASLRRAVG